MKDLCSYIKENKESSVLSKYISSGNTFYAIEDNKWGEAKNRNAFKVTIKEYLGRWKEGERWAISTSNGYTKAFFKDFIGKFSDNNKVKSEEDFWKANVHIRLITDKFDYDSPSFDKEETYVFTGNTKENLNANLDSLKKEDGLIKSNSKKIAEIDELIASKQAEKQKYLDEINKVTAELYTVNSYESKK